MSTIVSGLSGWIGAALTLAIFAIAFRYQSTAAGLLAAALSGPFCIFAHGYPIVGVIAWAALVFNFVAACAVRRRRDLAFAALTPFAVICVFLAVLALRGIRLVRG